eukprot:gene29038-biopygen18566
MKFSCSITEFKSPAHHWWWSTTDSTVAKIELQELPSQLPVTDYRAAASNVLIINKLVSGDKVISLNEVQLFNNGVQIPRESLVVTLSNVDLCHTADGDTNPTMTIVSAVAFDKVVVYNRFDCCRERITGATITASSNGLSRFTTFPSSAAEVYTFVLSSSGLQLAA